jgi:hypothetical protein
MIKYTEKEEEIVGGVFSYIEKIDEAGVISFIPKDPANSDYQRYLNPEAEQSTPLTGGE